ncbi:hypothetical protein PIB30_086024 [Stylosanthes scabra]|uniref:Uncharacterized protein n=1 Tax=Stylosanthes scabra TaxID=79078 RepID=A0ABU6ST97_9FABA|nr:hypothetical protein [Stylosanthes scabra]
MTPSTLPSSFIAAPLPLSRSLAPSALLSPSLGLISINPSALSIIASVLPSRFVPPNQWLLPPLESESPSPSSSTSKLVSLFSFNPSLRFSNAGSSLPSLLHGRVRYLFLLE